MQHVTPAEKYRKAPWEGKRKEKKILSAEVFFFFFFRDEFAEIKITNTFPLLSNSAC